MLDDTVVMSFSAQNGPGETRFTRYTGRCIEDLGKDTVKLKIIIPQLLPAADGAVDPTTDTGVVRTLNESGNPEEIRTSTSNYITATWFGASNRKYPPTVRKGEQVDVWQIGDTDKYFWESAGRDPELRKLEVFRLEISGKTTSPKALDDTNSYFFEMNSQTGRIELSTSKANGEKVAYKVLMDGANGIFRAADDLGNLFTINSVESIVRASNKDGSLLDLNKLNAMLAAKDDVILKGGRQLVLETPQITSIAEGGAGVFKVNAKEIAFDTQDGVTATGACIGLNGQVKTSSSIIAGGPIKATGYSTGAGGSPYGLASTNPSDGTGSGSGNSPDSITADPNARFSAAHEQLIEMAQAIEDMFNEVATSVGVPVNINGVLTSIATNSKMPKNSGE